MFKKATVVMLPTSQKANGLWWSGHKLYIKCPEDHSRGEINHLYILSDDEIKEGDWCYGLLHGDSQIFQYRNKHGELLTARKIIATTDISLKLKEHCTCSESEAIYCGYPKIEGLCQQLLPQLSQSFIEKYIEEYNKGDIITDVLVEYYWEPFSGIEQLPAKLKVSKNNTITIRVVKNSWTRGDVEGLLRKFADHVDELYRKYTPNNIEAFNALYGYQGKTKWLEENL